MDTMDVGDAVELTFEAASGSTVTVSWINPAGVAVVDQLDVVENPTGSGKYPYTLLPNAPGMWTAQFTASGAATAVDRYYIRANPLTGPPPLATPDELAELFRPLTDAERDKALALLRRASAMVRTVYPDIDARIAAGELDPGAAAHAVVNMAMRVMRNPGGLKAETVGPFSRTFDTTAAAGLLTITATETALLASQTAKPTTARTIRIQPGLAPGPQSWHHGRRHVGSW